MEPFRTADILREEESLVVVPSSTSISGNGLMSRAYEVIDHASQTGIRPDLEVMLDDR